jgi:hypothetical protein
VTTSRVCLRARAPRPRGPCPSTLGPTVCPHGPVGSPTTWELHQPLHPAQPLGRLGTEWAYGHAILSASGVRNHKHTHVHTHIPYTFLGKGKPPKPLSLCWGATAKQAGRTPSARDSSRTHMLRNAACPHAHTQFRAGSRPQRPPYAASGAGTSAYAVGSPPLASRPLRTALLAFQAAMM